MLNSRLLNLCTVRRNELALNSAGVGTGDRCLPVLIQLGRFDRVRNSVVVVLDCDMVVMMMATTMSDACRFFSIDMRDFFCRRVRMVPAATEQSMQG